MSVRIINADVIDGLRQLPDESVQCCVTSPPYWGLRDYGTGSWQGGDPSCDHKGAAQQSRSSTLSGNGHGGGKPLSPQLQSMAVPFRSVCGKCGGVRVDQQIGLEDSPEAFVGRLVDVFREVRRVLKPDGVCWVNLGDSYANGDTGIGRGKRNTGIKPKDLVGIPWRVAFALQADGWWLRQDIVWSKPNPMPESVTDRCTKSHEYVFLLTKSARYYYDAEAIKERAVAESPGDFDGGPQRGRDGRNVNDGRNYRIGAKGNANGFRGGAYVNGATFDNAEGGKRTRRGNRKAGNKSHKYVDQYEAEDGQQHRTKAGMMKVAETEWASRNKRSVWTVATAPFSEAHFATFPPALIEPMILAGSKRGDTVLDPFGGSGTTGLVADRLQRNAVLIELNPEYAAMAERRINGDRGGLLDAMEAHNSPMEALWQEAAE